MPILADSPHDRAEQLLTLTQRLTVLLRAELAEIEAHREPDPAQADERARLANLYRQEMLLVTQDRSRLAGLAGGLRDRLEQATRAFTGVIEAHARAVAALKEISEGLVQVVAGEMARMQAGPARYDSGGYATRSSAPVAVAVNRSA